MNIMIVKKVHNLISTFFGRVSGTQILQVVIGKFKNEKMRHTSEVFSGESC